MKCERCKSEWLSPQNRQSIFCPFCRAPLIKVEEKFDDLSTALSYMVLEFGIDILRNKQNSEKYVYWLGEAAERDYAEAQFLLGKELYNGHICEKNVSSALLYLEHAVKNSSIDAMCFILSNIEIQALKTFDLKKIENYLLERKEELSSNQLVQLSKYFEKYDLTQTLELTKLSYAKDAKNTWQYYVALLNRVGSHESKAIALKITKDIAIEGNVIACLLLAKRYENQASTENDMLTALYWYRMAAEGGELEAQLHLGEIYENGKLVKKDMHYIGSRI